MSLVIGTNVSSLAAQRSLAESGRLMETAMERLSTGKKINSGADDAAGLAKAMKMDGRIAGLSQAGKNIADGKAMVSAIDTSLEEVQDILVRMREIGVQAASDTTSSTDRARIQNEYVSLQSQLTAIANNTRFNGQEVLNGSYTGKLIQIGAVSGETISVSQSSVKANTLGGHVVTGAARAVVTGNSPDSGTGTTLNTNSTSDHFTITVDGTSTWNGTTNHAADADETAESAAADVNANTGLHGVTATAKTFAFLDFGATSNAVTGLKINGTQTAGFTASATALTAAVNAINAISTTTGITARETASDIELFSATGKSIVIENLGDGKNGDSNAVTLDSGTFAGVRNGAATALASTGSDGDVAMAHGTIQFTGDSAFTIDENANTATQNITGNNSTAVNSAATALSTGSMSTVSGASTALGIIDGAIGAVAKMRGDLGAIVNRLDHSADSVLAEKISIEEARSMLVDADFAKESAELAKAQVLQQVGTAMLAQANAQPQLVLQLLQ